MVFQVHNAGLHSNGAGCYARCEVAEAATLMSKVLLNVRLSLLQYLMEFDSGNQCQRLLDHSRIGYLSCSFIAALKAMLVYIIVYIIMSCHIVLLRFQ